MDTEEIKCSKCDSHEWQGYLHCKTCGSYFILAKCKNCDNLRLEKCPIDEEGLEFIASKDEIQKKT